MTQNKKPNASFKLKDLSKREHLSKQKHLPMTFISTKSGIEKQRDKNNERNKK